MKLWVKVLGLALVAVLFGAMLWWFQPWRVFTESAVMEPLKPSQSEAAEGDENQAQSEPKQLYEGAFISHEHTTTGSAAVLELEDGSRILRLEGFETSDGPDLEVWLSDAHVIEGYDGWFLADDSRYLSLGKLKGSKGNQNYEIPAEVNLEDYGSAVIWCARFAVSFGAAELLASN